MVYQRKEPKENAYWTPFRQRGSLSSNFSPKLLIASRKSQGVLNRLFKTTLDKNPRCSIRYWLKINRRASLDKSAGQR